MQGKTIKFAVPLCPITKKNHQRILKNAKTGKSFIAQSKQYKDYEAQALWFIPKNHHIDYPVNVKSLFYMPTRRRCDLTGLHQAIDDIMVRAGLLRDDNYTIVAGHDGSRVLYDKDNPRTEITITPMEETYG